MSAAFNATRFSFGSDLRAPPSATALSHAEIAGIEERARAEGREAGRREAEAAAQGRLATATERIEAALPALAAGLEARMAEIEAEAVRVALRVARTIAGDALAAHPLDAVATVAAEAFSHLRGVKHLAIRVHESLVEPVEAMTARMGRERGFEGRVIVLGEPDIEPGDARLEWADGGVLRERRQLEAQIARIGAELGLAAPTDTSPRIS